ncbi:polyphosphate kinase 1 [Thiohalomonas denitrificans]|uniref:polyphosphate kinase 1 n=1 Tax=Thiohalomonas denitrificans TaxID=415747 RepID=UPI0026F01CAE|nr:polyphosphate kinase 1 [Thiohalomonas denitrificans]
MDTPDLKKPEYYINRELSLLEFNRRVLAQAKDENMPLLERLRFICITSSNMDEFFEIRVAGLMQKAASESVQYGPDNLSPTEILKRISQTSHALVDEQYRVLNEVLLPLLAAEQIRFVKRGDWNREQAAWVRDFFKHELLPVLSPLGLDPAHPFPKILNKSLNFIVTLEGKDAFGRSSGMAVVQAPRALPRLIQLPAECGSGPKDYVFLSSIIHAHVGDLFPGMRVKGCYQFRVTRNSDLFVDEEEVKDLLRAVEGELPSRRYGEAVRLEAADNCPPDVTDFLLDQFGLSRDDLFIVNGPVNLNRLMNLPDMVDRPDLKFPSYVPGMPEPFTLSTKDVFKIVRTGDVLLHHPFESFVPVIDFLRQAATDPNVLAIKQTLYRTGPESAVVDALVDAARAGKEVTVVVELRARFDEAANIALANRLQEAGAHVVYGVVGYKTHAKMILVVRREEGKLRHYVHLGTGNYHSRTARLYTDYGLLTCDRDLGEDVHQVFLQLTSLGRGSRLKKLLQAPFTLHKGLIERIEREAEHACQGRPAQIIAKMNGLVEPKVIRALYTASRAGVKIDLVVRGICGLRPGVPGISDNIRVRSIVGRFLEHTRVNYFANGGDAEVYCSSADWMVRNLLNRVETAFPIENRQLQQRIIRELKYYLQDNVQAWELHSDGTYVRAAPGRAKPRSAQLILLEELAGVEAMA